MFTNNQFKNKSGFTLIETFVAITILMIAILGPMSIIAKFYADSTFAKNQIAASFLAQDGLETVANIIDNNTGNRWGESCVVDSSGNTPVNWLQDLGDCVASGCNVDSTQERSVVPCPDINTANCQMKKIENIQPQQTLDNGFYVLANNSSGRLVDTIFKRRITITDSSFADTFDGSNFGYATGRREAKVISEVSWIEKDDPHSVVVSSLILQSQCQ